MPSISPRIHYIRETKISAEKRYVKKRIVNYIRVTSTKNNVINEMAWIITSKIFHILELDFYHVGE
jgi:hypothetical protein